MDRNDKRKAGFPNLLGRTSKPDNATKNAPASLSDTKKTNGSSEGSGDDGFGTKKESHPPIEKSASRDLAPNTTDNPMREDNEITNHVSADLTEQDKREIYDAIDLIRRKLSFAKDFTEEERAGLMRLGKTGRNFVEKAQNLVERSPGILPRSFDLEEFNRDADLYQELGNINDELQKLTERVADTEAAVGSDAFTASLVVYQSGKLARTGDDMDNHLAGWRRKISDSPFD